MNDSLSLPENLKDFSLSDSRLDDWPGSVLKGLQWLKELDPSIVSNGKTVIDGDRVYANVFSYSTHHVSEAVFESHREYIDIHFVVSGSDLMGTVRRSESTCPLASYDAEQDVEIFPASIIPGLGAKDQSGSRENLFPIRSGEFVVFGPDDIHTSGLCYDESREVRKIVVKCKISQSESE